MRPGFHASPDVQQHETGTERSSNITHTTWLNRPDNRPELAKLSRSTTVREWKSSGGTGAT